MYLQVFAERSKTRMAETYEYSSTTSSFTFLLLGSPLLKQSVCIWHSTLIHCLIDGSFNW